MHQQLPRAAKAAVVALVLLLALSGCGGSKGPIGDVMFPNASDEDRAAIGAFLKDDLSAAVGSYQQLLNAMEDEDFVAARAAVGKMGTARDAAQGHLQEVNSSSKAVTALEHYAAALTDAVRAANGVLAYYGNDEVGTDMRRGYRVDKAFRDADSKMARSDRELVLIMLDSASGPHRDALRADYRKALRTLAKGSAVPSERRAAPRDGNTTTMRSLLHKGFSDASDREVEAAVVLSRDFRVLDRVYGDVADARSDQEDREAATLVEKATARELAARSDLVELEDPDLRAAYEDLFDSTLGYLQAYDDFVLYVDPDPKRDRRLKRELDAAVRAATEKRAVAESALRQRLMFEATPDERKFLEGQAAASPV